MRVLLTMSYNNIVLNIIPTFYAGVMVRPWKAGNYLRNRKLARFRVIRMAFCIRNYHEKRRARARISDAITTLGIIKLLLYYVCLLRFKVSNRDGLENRQTCKGILCVSAQSPYNMASSAGPAQLYSISAQNGYGKSSC